MKSQTKVVVIGGGIAGCSTLYHLTQEGWSDVVLVERDELTSGTTNTITGMAAFAWPILRPRWMATGIFHPWRGAWVLSLR